MVVRSVCADRHAKKSKGRRSGQALIEFLLLFPAMLVVTIFLLRANSAAQVSAVNQKYARAQALFLAYNSPVYPERRFRENLEVSEMTMGVSDDLAEPSYVPDATSINLARKGSKAAANDDAKTEPALRARVRVRDSVTLCTQTNLAVGNEPNRSFCQGISR